MVPTNLEANIAGCDILSCDKEVEMMRAQRGLAALDLWRFCAERMEFERRQRVSWKA